MILRLSHILFVGLQIDVAFVAHQIVKNKVLKHIKDELSGFRFELVQ